MKKLLLILFVLISSISFSQKRGEYYAKYYKTSYSDETKLAKDVVIEVDYDRITVSVGNYDPLIYFIINSELDGNKRIFSVTKGDGIYSQFIIGLKGDSYGVMLSEGDEYMYYICPTVKFY